ncbi:MAG: diaminopimelate decarboxylase [Pseudobutyrivibrio sp.]|nr:diaminopimelate decarboxylase [Pseudobutyrivibrio sp.]
MKKPFVTKEKIQEIVKEIPTPFNIYDEKGIRENARAVNEAFSWNKGFKEYFAVKALPNPFILKILGEEGCGLDCASQVELALADACGFKKDDIMFSSNDTPAEEFRYADELGVIVNLDDFTHIDFYEKSVGHFPKKMCCRYNPGGTYEISNGIMDNPGDSKYGMTKDQIMEAYKILRDKGVEELGIHAFLVSNTVTNDYYPALAKDLFELLVEIKEKTGIALSFVNLSGGVGIPYKPDQTANDIAVIGQGVRKAYEEVLVPAGLGEVAIFTEMGRFMTGPYGGLVTEAIHEKHIYKEYIGVDACAVDLMRPAVYGSYHHITVLGKENAPATETYDVTGSLCENCDKFAIDRQLPKIEMGDYLFIHDTGAHGYSMGYNYNGKLKSAEVLLKEDGSYKLIRKPETIQNYLATFEGMGIVDDLLK